jgi:hypothetical protein
MENLCVQMDINEAWEAISENIRISAKESLGYYEMNKYKTWFDEECPKLVYKSKKSHIAVVTESKQIKW